MADHKKAYAHAYTHEPTTPWSEVPEIVGDRVDLALYLHEHEGMSVRAAAREARVNPSTIVRRKQKLRKGD